MKATKSTISIIIIAFCLSVFTINCNSSIRSDETSPDVANTTWDIIEDIVLDIGDADDITEGSDDSNSPQDGYINDIIEEDVAFVCPEACNMGCDDGNCHIEGTELDDVQCPDNIPCVVHCELQSSCHKPVKCGNQNCTILCSGHYSCRYGVDCGDAPECHINCTGDLACEGKLTRIIHHPLFS